MTEEALQHPSTTDAWLDRIVDDRYRVLMRVGQGGMGVVYKVEHVRIGKVAAMKLLHRRLCGEAALLKRFRVEAEAISRLNHPNIVQVFDYGHVEEQPYLVMEFLHGEDLGTIVKRDGPLALRRCIPLLMQICDALTEAHELHIVHRDLKPENIQISRTRAGLDHAKVLDFGLAKVVGDGQSATDSAHGNLVGTPYYMAPEQIRGQPLDQRCDIYALGALTYRIITGNHAFAARTPVGVLTKHITEDLVPPSQSAPELNISAAMDEVIGRAMAKAPDDRFSTVGAMKAALVDAANRSFSGEVPLDGAVEVPGLDHPRAESPGLGHPPTPFTADSNDAILALARDSADDLTIESEEEGTGPPDRRRAVALDLTPPRLTRADLRFERHLYRGRRVAALLIMLLVLGAAGSAGWWFFLRPQPNTMPTVESEPNNATAQATRLGKSHPVTGQIGKRLTPTQSDLDFYVLRVEGSGTQALRLEVSQIPNIDLMIELYDRLGGELTAVDATATGGEEALINWPVQPGTYYVVVRETLNRKTSIPTENITDHYEIKADWSRLAPGWEREPNDRDRQSELLTLGQPIRGHLSAPTDVDTYRLEVPAGKLEGLVSGLEGVDVVVAVRSSGHEKARTFDAESSGGGERIYGIRSDGKKPVYIRVRRKIQNKRGKTLPARDRPYTLRFWRPK